MSILKSDHLFEQADKLIAPPAAGPPRQVDLRRAISAAYYGLFHFVLTEAADALVGKVHRQTKEYALVYRSIDHRTFKELCFELGKNSPAKKYLPFVPAGRFGPNIRAFAAAAGELQDKRHKADYDPLSSFKTSDARLAIATARDALQRFLQAAIADRKAFLILLVCPPR